MIVLTTGKPGEGMSLGRLAPVPDSLRFGQSNGAKMLEALRARARMLDYPRIGRELPPDYDRQCFDVACRLREQGNYLIQVGVR
ncbi:hypothetical protein [Comamonas jiangduensis]|uniref:hypothetical protein n=1 Tax=Comamonas jiangduensis TaxID=1194168 RepID=UPI0028AFBAD7|nr:hypothetical protein [Comamonas jiangduensis]